MQIAEPAVPAAATLIVFTTIASVFVSLRLYTRIVIVKNVGADDYLILASIAGSITFLVVVFLQIKYGLGRRVTLEELPSFLEALWGTVPLYNVAIIFCKLSIALQYYRVFRIQLLQRVLKGILVFLALYGLWAVLGTIFTCYPVQKYWDFTVTEGKCLDRNAITFVNAGVNIATDLVLLAIPIPLLKNLQIPKKQKFILVGVFACGAFACAMSIIRLKALYEIGRAPQEQQSIDGVNIAIWSCIEINVGIMCACVPALKALAVRVFPKFVLSNLYARSKNPYVRYGQYAQQPSGTDASRGADSSANERKRPQITVLQSFEMNAVTSQDATAAETISQDGSERDLVMSGSGWKADCYAGQGRRRDSPSGIAK